MSRSPSVPREKNRTPVLGEGLTSFAVSLPKEDVVYLKGLLEAHDGIGSFFAEKGGLLTVFTTTSQWEEMRNFLAAMQVEIPSLTFEPVLEQGAPDAS